MKILLTEDLIKSQVEILMKLLKDGVCDKCHTATSITRSSAYDYIAKMYGQKDWSHLSDIIKES